MNKTIEELLAQTRPVRKGPKIRGKAKKCRNKTIPKGIYGAAAPCFDINQGLMYGMSGLASSLASQQASNAGAQAQAQASDAQVAFLRKQLVSSQHSGLYGGGYHGLGNALGAAFGQAHKW